MHSLPRQRVPCHTMRNEMKSQRGLAYKRRIAQQPLDSRESLGHSYSVLCMTGHPHLAPRLSGSDLTDAASTLVDSYTAKLSSVNTTGVVRQAAYMMAGASTGLLLYSTVLRSVLRTTKMATTCPCLNL